MPRTQKNSVTRGPRRTNAQVVN